MAAGNVVFAFLTALVAVNIIFAEENLLPGDVAYDQADENYEREERLPKEDIEGLQERTFSRLFPMYPTSCNNTRGSVYCANCNQVIFGCNSNNRGILRTCGFLLPYCNRGRCSFIRGEECNSS